VRLLSLGNVHHHPPYVKEALASIVSNNLLLIAVGLFLLAIVLFARLITGNGGFSQLVSGLKNYQVLLAFCLLLTGAYVFFFYGFWAFFRYLYPLSLLLALYLAEVLDFFVVRTLQPLRLKLFAVMAIVLIVLAYIPSSEFRLLFLAHQPKRSGYMQMGLWAKDHLPNGTKLGSGQSGALGYFATNLQVINLDGVVNAASYEALLRKRFCQYAREIGLQYVLGWDSEIRFFKRSSRPYQKGELLFVRKLTGIHCLDREIQLYQVNPQFRRR
jgi:hypothetical protein